MSDITLPTDDEIAQRMTELEYRGVPVQLPCGKCNRATEATVLPEERDRPGPEPVSVCRNCAETHLREAGFL